MAKTFGQLRTGDIIFSTYRSGGRYYIRPYKVQSQCHSMNNTYVSYWLNNYGRSPQFYPSNTIFSMWGYDKWYTSYEDCLKNLHKNQT